MSEVLPSYGQRPLPSLIDEIAQREPDCPYVSIPRTSDAQDGFKDISFLTFARSINRCSWWIEEHLGKGQGFNALSYMGPQDLLYAILLISAIKTGHKMFFSSPRNTIEAHLSLLEALQCHVFLVPHSPLPVVKSLLSRRPMQILSLPDLDYWLQESDVAIYPYLKTMTEAYYDPFVALHSSGSTGIPKAIVMNHGTIAAQDAFQSLPSMGGKPWHGHYWKGKRVFLSFPLFHAAGLCFLLPICIYHRITPVLPPSSRPLTAEIVDSVHVYGNVRAGLYTPSTLVDVSKDPAYLRNLRLLEHVSFGGGPLSKETGDLISTRTQVSAVFGTTEAAFLPTVIPDSEDWQYLSYSSFLGQEFRYFGDDLYEHVMVRTKNPEMSVFQAIFCTFQNLEEFPTKDLYSKHPTKAGLWLYCGRTDDMIVYSNGEKLNPAWIEGILEGHPDIVSALVCGHGKFQSALLVEPVTIPFGEQERINLLNEIWPTIERANQQSPAQGQLSKDLVLFTTAEKAMSRAGKGTVQRKKTLDIYKEELDELYSMAATNTQYLTVQDSFNSSGEPHMKDTLLDLIRTTTKLDITLTENMFDFGLDSLQVLNLVKQINRMQVRRGRGHSLITSKTIYGNPTVHNLEIVLGRIGDEPETNESRFQTMQEYLAHHRTNLPFNARVPVSSVGQPLVKLLTVSTGSLGSYLLDVMTQDSSISKVYCLNRGSDSGNRQKDLQETRGLSTAFSHTEFLQCDISKPYLGLEPSVYIMLLQNVTPIVHNAWEVNFNLPISSFSTQIHGVRQMIDFSSRSAKGAVIFFISSISTVMNWGVSDIHRGKVPEEILDDWNLPENMGYAESKFVAERLLSAAQKEVEVPSVICRVGQIAGPIAKRGMWSKQEWIPSIVASSKYLGQIPDSLGSMDAVEWIPVNFLARIILDLVKCHTAGKIACGTKPVRADKMDGTNGDDIQDDSSGNRVGYANNGSLSQVYHAVNPSPITWSTLVPVVQKYLSASSHPLTVAPLASWVSALRQSAASTPPEEVASRNPALKLLDFLETIQTQGEKGVQPTVFETKKTLYKSAVMRDLGPVRPEWMVEWMGQWDF